MFICNKNLSFLIDTGSPISLIKRQFVKHYEIKNNVNFITLAGITGQFRKIYGIANLKFNISNNFSSNHDFIVCSDKLPLETCGILGRDFLKKFRVKIDFFKEEIIINNNKYFINSLKRRLNDKDDDDTSYIDRINNEDTNIKINKQNDLLKVKDEKIINTGRSKRRKIKNEEIKNQFLRKKILMIF